MRIKVDSEDFLVDEVLDENMFTQSGAFCIYVLKKRNYTTERAVTHIAKALRVARKDVGYCGAKDKNAVTTQYISIRGSSKEKIDALELQDIELEFKGYMKEPLALGMHQGNRFTILVRDVDMTDVKEHFFVPNYFDDQRFSSHNVEIGMMLLKKQFKEAVEKLLAVDKDAVVMQYYLDEHQGDYVGALKRLPTKNLIFYVHSVQSLLFNESLSNHIVQSMESFESSYSQGQLRFPQELIVEDSGEELDLAGFAKSSDMLGKYGLATSDFIVRQLPELSVEGTSRKMWSEVTACSLEKKEEGVVASFVLGTGSYATIVLRQIFRDSFAN